MKHLLLSLALSAPLLAGPPPAGAADADTRPLVPLPSVFDVTRGGGWGGALGLGVEYEAAYDGSDEYDVELDPAGAIQWRRGNHLLFWEGAELGWRGLFPGAWLIQAGARYEEGLEPDDSEDGRLDGIAERDAHLVGFLEVRRGLGDDWRHWVGARTMGGESDFGWLGVLAAGRRFGDRLDGLGTEAFVFTTFGNAAFINKDFGVTAADADASGLNATTLDGGYRSVGLTLIDRRNLTDHLHLITQVGVEHYNDDIANSPIARDAFEAEAGVSLVYWF